MNTHAVPVRTSSFGVIKFYTDLEALQRKMRTILCKSGLNGAATIKTMNTYAVPVFTYSFGVIKWSYTDLETLQWKMRTSIPSSQGSYGASRQIIQVQHFEK